MKYSEYDVSDFLADQYFVQSVRNPSDESTHFWEDWLKANPSRLETYQLARELALSINYQSANTLPEADYSTMLEDLVQRNNEVENSRNRRLPYKSLLKIAAMITIALGSGFWYFDSSPDVEKAVTSHWEQSSTPYGQKKIIYLPDGSKVILNAGSQLSFPKVFEGKKRAVQLQGEAFFDVVKNPERPFVIQSGSIETTVLGTTFNVSSYPETDLISVAVVTGKVKVASQTGHQVQLTPSEKAVFDRTTSTLEVEPFDIGYATAWTEGTLAFANEDLDQIFSRLEKWYGVTIEISEGVALNGKYTGRYEKESLEVVLKGISYTSGFGYSIDQKKIFIHP